ncbi:MAG: hypothetical protein E5V19_02570 [Mesorhizobium sp.]|nr:MAG: hypothetical protein E5V19_02570 [Mesorhizobium sp.]
MNNVRPYVTNKLPSAPDEKRKGQYRMYPRLHVLAGRDRRSMEWSNVPFLDYLRPGIFEQLADAEITWTKRHRNYWREFFAIQ